MTVSYEIARVLRGLTHNSRAKHAGSVVQRTLAFTAVFLAVLIAGSHATAEAAKSSVKSRKSTKPSIVVPRLQPMRITIARAANADCEHACPEWIAADGDIVPGSPAELRRVLKKLGKRKLPILVNSRGGSVEGAIGLARLIRKNKLDVGVAATDFLPCSTPEQACKRNIPIDGAKATPRDLMAICASSCTFLLAGGVNRIAGSEAGIGVHEIKAFRTLVKVRRIYKIQQRVINGRPVEVSRKLVSEKQISSRTTEAAVNDDSYRQISAFLREMDIDQSLIPLFRSTPNSSIRWLTAAERERTRLITTSAIGSSLVAMPKLHSESADSAVSGELPITGTEHFDRVTVTIQRRSKSVEVVLEPRSNGAPYAYTSAMMASMMAPGAAGLAIPAPDQPHRLSWRLASEPRQLCPAPDRKVLTVGFRIDPTQPVIGVAELNLETTAWVKPLLTELCSASKAAAN